MDGVLLDHLPGEEVGEVVAVLPLVEEAVVVGAAWLSRLARSIEDPGVIPVREVDDLLVRPSI